MTLPSGGRSLYFAEPIASKWFPRNGTQFVHVVREATLTPDLSEIDDRRLRAIRVYLGSNTGHPQRDVDAIDMDREAVIHLRDALNAALAATEKELSV